MKLIAMNLICVARPRCSCFLHYIVGKRYIQTAWKLAIDTFRTLSPLQFPPHEIALAALYANSLLLLTPASTSKRASYLARSVDPGGTPIDPEEDEVQNVLAEAARWKDLVTDEIAFEKEYLVSMRNIDGMSDALAFRSILLTYSSLDDIRCRTHATGYLYYHRNGARYINRPGRLDTFNIP